MAIGKRQRSASLDLGGNDLFAGSVGFNILENVGQVQGINRLVKIATKTGDIDQHLVVSIGPESDGVNADIGREAGELGDDIRGRGWQVMYTVGEQDQGLDSLGIHIGLEHTQSLTDGLPNGGAAVEDSSIGRGAGSRKNATHNHLQLGGGHDDRISQIDEGVGLEYVECWVACAGIDRPGVFIGDDANAVIRPFLQENGFGYVIDRRQEVPR